MTDLLGANLSRRDALKRGALVGGTLLWAVPAVQAVSMTAASAAAPSGGPGPENPPEGTKPPVTPTTEATTPTTPTSTPTTPTTPTTESTTPTTPTTPTSTPGSPTPSVDATQTEQPIPSGTKSPKPTPGTTVEGTTASKGSTGGALPFTGGNITTIAETGAALVALGVAATVGARRRAAVATTTESDTPTA
ncbi:MAG: hypothetical protein QOG52_536 [Frankiaceae bacterium]|nr:hypothetical protein [Frankiaceae bacterium]